MADLPLFPFPPPSFSPPPIPSESSLESERVTFGSISGSHSSASSELRRDFPLAQRTAEEATSLNVTIRLSGELASFLGLEENPKAQALADVLVKRINQGDQQGSEPSLQALREALEKMGQFSLTEKKMLLEVVVHILSHTSESLIAPTVFSCFRDPLFAASLGIQLGLDAFNSFHKAIRCYQRAIGIF